MFIALGLCLLLSFFLSGSETALTAINRMKVQLRADQGDIKSIKLRKLISKPDRMITAILIGNNIANILMPTIVTMIAIDKGLSIGLLTGILTVVLIIFGEVLPKTIAATFADRIAYIVAPPISVLVKLLIPLTLVLSLFTNFFVRLISKGTVTEATLTKEDVRSMVDIASTEGTFGQDESIRLKGMLDFRDKDVSDVMETHRTDIISLSMDSTYEDVRDVVLQYFYTRYPVYEESIDKVVGIFYSKMLIEWSMYPERKFSEVIDRQPLFVVQTASVELVFKRMLTQKKHMAIVLDEYGGTLGIVTQEDIIEEMIGQDIEDETDVEEESMVFEKEENHLICQGRLEIEDVIELLDIELPTDHDTIGGFVFQEVGHIPEEGEKFSYNSLLFEIEEMDRTRILRLKITKQEPKEEVMEA
ncbi:hemolysin [Sporosarcina sp. P21c]|uniref:hemolysin family protein n=1 Tax=Sporosarcina TaxID=1569 RepID=UPI000A149D8A|nr:MULTISPECIES: CNNM domain-containing protein [Sporosarcina]ARJ39448.1 hemolysin [Sporosarcina ureae]PIC66831.1 hemolysin [Sporosarcina sp. P16a]PIC83496.1 hemolysin [Sporosarcina sp. P1]PIC87464.1 hemolysin [Sporosarcina sp. P21c]PIC94169.1 hemolysin [Sporosarcina sp. P25]